MQNPLTTFILGVAGAIIGGLVGGFAYWLALRSGFYMLAFPGAAIGIGCGLLARTRSPVLGTICAVMAAALSLFLEWYTRPFIDDDSFSYFIQNLHKLTLLTWIMLGLGVFFAFWFSFIRAPEQTVRAGPES